jgi:hypothetical protein
MSCSVPVILVPAVTVGHRSETFALPEPGALEIIDWKKPQGPAESYLPCAADVDGAAPLPS